MRIQRQGRKLDLRQRTRGYEDSLMKRETQRYNDKEMPQRQCKRENT